MMVLSVANTSVQLSTDLESQLGTALLELFATLESVSTESTGRALTTMQQSSDLVRKVGRSLRTPGTDTVTQIHLSQGSHSMVLSLQILRRMSLATSPKRSPQRQLHLQDLGNQNSP